MVVNEAEVEAIADQMERVTQQQQEFERHLARSLGIDAAGLTAMEHLMRVHETTPSELSRTIGISTATMTLVLDRLEAAGHVSRKPHPTDRRKILITPTARTARAAQDLVDPLIEGVENLITTLHPHERTVVSNFLTGMLNVYGDVLTHT